MIELTLHAAPLGGSQPLRGDLVRPEGDGPWPGVVMVHEALGYDDVMRRQAERLAEAGFLTLAVDLFSAGGGKVRCMISAFRALTRGSGKQFADIEAARQYLLESPDCTGKIGVIGFCMGGGFALLTASKGFDASSVNYGMMPRDLSVLEGACPIVASYGERDQLAKVAGQLENELTPRSVVHDVKLYPKAGHSFLNDAETGPKLLRPIMRIAGVGPEPTAAADAWKRIDRFFHEHLTTGERPSAPAG